MVGHRRQMPTGADGIAPIAISDGVKPVVGLTPRPIWARSAALTLSAAPRNHRRLALILEQGDATRLDREQTSSPPAAVSPMAWWIL